MAKIALIRVRGKRVIDVESLYVDEDFMKFVNSNISRNIMYFDISDRSDYINDIFVEIMESDCHTIEDCKRAAWRVLYNARQELKKSPDSVLWEDNHIVGGVG